MSGTLKPDDLVGPAFDCPMHGSRSEECCPRARPLKQLKHSETLGGVPWAIRVDIRHELQELHSQCLEMRASMVEVTLPIDGTIVDFDRMIAKLNHCKRAIQGR